QREIFEFVAR
ncbi:hypothetical protein CMV_026853, partial [Castanea mollissima]